MKQKCLFIAAVETNGVFAQRSDWFIYLPCAADQPIVFLHSGLFKPVVGGTCAEAAGGQREKGAARTSAVRHPSSTAPCRTGDAGI